MESDKALAIGKVLTLALSPARRLLGQVIAKASVLPADGRGKSPGSRKTQFKPGHARLGGRRKTEPDLAKLLDQVCSGVRGSASTPKIDVLKLKLEELSQALNQKAGTKPKESKHEPVQESKGPASHQEPLWKICPGCRARVSFDRSQIIPGETFHHFCGARVRIGLDRGICWF
jgi:hypothetical protein